MFFRFVVISMLLAGCGSSPFTSQVFSDTPDDGGVVPHVDALPFGSGGASGDATGGAPKADTGATGGRGFGGVEETGGRVSVHAGGAAGTGGAPETGGVVGTGGATVIDAGCTLITHDNGLGQTWQDCVPLGTYNEAQATKACKVSGATTCTANPGNPTCNGANRIVCGSGSSFVGCWGYAGFVAGYVSRSGAPCLGPGSTSNHPWD